MGTCRDISLSEIKQLKNIVDSDEFVSRIESLSRAYRRTREYPMPHPLDSEKLVAGLLIDANKVVEGLREADRGAHPLGMSMKNYGLDGGEILRSAKNSLLTLISGLEKIKVMSRPGLKKTRGHPSADVDLWLADTLADVLDSHSVKRSNYKSGPLANCINIVRSAAGYTKLTDPCKKYQWIANQSNEDCNLNR